jgi:hypothetical protein
VLKAHQAAELLATYALTPKRITMITASLGHIASVAFETARAGDPAVAYKNDVLHLLDLFLLLPRCSAAARCCSVQSASHVSAHAERNPFEELILAEPWWLTGQPLHHRRCFIETAIRMRPRAAIALDELDHHVIGGSLVPVRKRVVRHDPGAVDPRLGFEPREQLHGTEASKRRSKRRLQACHDVRAARELLGVDAKVGLGN